MFYQKGEQPVKRVKIEDTAEQIKRYEDARAKAAEQLQGLYEKALKEVGEANAAVFEVHQMMLEDDDYIDSVVNIIETQQVNAEFAVATTGDNFAKMFAEMEDDYFKARAADVKDISERMVNILSGNESGGAIGDEPVIVVAEDLAPSETVQMDKEKLLAFVTRLGSANSHTAILARTMNIPALIEVDIKEEWNGKMAVVDGYTGTFYIDPDEETLKKMQEKKEEDIKARELLQELKGKREFVDNHYSDTLIQIWHYYVMTQNMDESDKTQLFQTYIRDIEFTDSNPIIISHFINRGEKKNKDIWRYIRDGYKNQTKETDWKSKILFSKWWLPIFKIKMVDNYNYDRFLTSSLFPKVLTDLSLSREDAE